MEKSSKSLFLNPFGVLVAHNSVGSKKLYRNDNIALLGHQMDSTFSMQEIDFFKETEYRGPPLVRSPLV